MTGIRDEAFYDALPKLRYGATALIRNQLDELLLVRDRGAVGWSLPGGHAAGVETPVECCERKIEEELGLELHVGCLLVVHLMPALPPKPPGFQFAFDCGRISNAQAEERIRLPYKLEGWVFATQQESLQLLSPLLGRRVTKAYEIWRAHDEGRAAPVGELWERHWVPRSPGI
jgi:8-oxo-dGTP diphosphatase